MFQGQGNRGRGHFHKDTCRGNMYGPSHQTCHTLLVGYNTSSRVNRDLVIAFQTLPDASSEVKPIHDSHILKIYHAVV